MGADLSDYERVHSRDALDKLMGTPAAGNVPGQLSKDTGARAIVFLLAECPAPIVDGHNGRDFCLLCGKNDVYDGSLPGEHFDDCPWRRAKEWAADGG